MENVFEIKDKSGRTIHLSKERWSHIKSKHSNVDNYEIIYNTITNPERVIQINEYRIIFYRYIKHRKESAKFLKVIVKYLNDTGYVVTSYFVRNPL